ncbi:hypothetical protein HDU79_003195 [Rhizoclosmatium sp. JEL0117]|nr:hypothetical protein HDU79_003195 [Rhizoclosmatium sp. JEL0117]
MSPTGFDAFCNWVASINVSDDASLEHSNFDGLVQVTNLELPLKVRWYISKAESKDTVIVVKGTVESETGFLCCGTDVTQEKQATKEVSELRDEIATRQKDLSTERDNYDKQLTHLKKCMQTLESENSALMKLRALSKAEVTRLDDVVAQLRSELDTIKDRAEKNASKVETEGGSEETWKQKDAFVDKMCHEIRNPLNGIMHCNENIRFNLSNIQEVLIDIKGTPQLDSISKLIKAEVRNAMEDYNLILLCSKHQKMMLDDVIYLSKINTKPISFDLAPFSPTDLIHEIMDSFQYQYEMMHITSTILFKGLLESDHNQMVIGDKNAISQILINIINFAMRFKQNANLQRVKVTTSILENLDIAPKVELRVSVKDSGIGMTVEELKIVFKELLYSPQKIRAEFGGPGLGLYIAKNLVDLMGGNFDLRSIHETGSSYSFTIILDKVPSALVATDLEDLPALPAKTILVVDDNEINRKVLCGILKKAGYQTAQAQNGLEAFAAVCTMNFDMIFMDIEMPVSNGTDSTMKIREWESKQKFKNPIPIVAVTGNARTDQMQEYLGAGMQAVVVKPFRQDEIVKVLEEMKQMRSRCILK